MKPTPISLLALALIFAIAQPAYPQASTARLKVTRSSKSDTKTNYRSTDGRYTDQDKQTSIIYKIVLSNASGGPARDFTIKWAVLVRSDEYWYRDGQSGRGGLRVVEGEQTCTLEFGKTFSFDTDVIELQASQSTFGGRRVEQGAKVLGYCVEVFSNEQRVAADIQPADTKKKIEQVAGEGEQKRRQF